jgi:hypothetical protein
MIINLDIKSIFSNINNNYHFSQYIESNIHLITGFYIV